MKYISHNLLNRIDSLVTNAYYTAWLWHTYLDARDSVMVTCAGTQPLRPNGRQCRITFLQLYEVTYICFSLG
jgi:hypothetical protein